MYLILVITPFISFCIVICFPQQTFASQSCFRIHLFPLAPRECFGRTAFVHFEVVPEAAGEGKQPINTEFSFDP